MSKLKITILFMKLFALCISYIILVPLALILSVVIILLFLAERGMI